MLLILFAGAALLRSPPSIGPHHMRPSIHRPAVQLMADDISEEERRKALRLPDPAPAPPPLLDDVLAAVEARDDSMDPLGGGEAGDAMFEQAEYRVRRRAAAGEFDGASSRTVPLIALVAQVVFNGLLGAFLLYCYVLNAEAANGTPWAVEALAGSDRWMFGFFSKLFWGKPPGGPWTLFYAGLNGANALRCAPQLFDRVVVTRLPRSDDSEAEEGGEGGDEPTPAAQLDLVTAVMAKRASATSIVMEEEQEEPAVEEEEPKAAPVAAAPAEEMTMMDNLVFVGYIGGFVAFFYLAAGAINGVTGK